MVPLIGLAGYAGSGKDTAAKVLIDRGYTRRAFADNVKKLAAQINPLVKIPAVVGTSGCVLRYEVERLTNLIDQLGAEVAKRLPEVREVYQAVGQGCRDVDLEFWIRPVREQLVNAEFGEDEGGMFVRYVIQPSVITDVRYPNEVEMIRELGGVIVWIDRPGNEPANGHESESDLSGLADVVIINSGTVDMLHKAILKAVEC